MKKMTVSEFGRFLDSSKPNGVILCSENQRGIFLARQVRFNLTFKSIKVSVSPNSVNLLGESGSVCLKKAKYVLVDSEKSVLGAIADVVCDSFCAPSGENRYTLILN